MNDNYPTVSVIIPTYRDTHNLQQCIAALSRQTLPSNHFEVVLVNNDPSNRIAIDSYNLNLRIIDEQRPGSYAARNAGISNSASPLVAFTDSDCAPAPNWLETIVRELPISANSTKLLITGPILVEVAPIAPNHTRDIGHLYDALFAFPVRRYVRQGHCTTANLATYRTTFNDLGKFNPALLSGGDVEWTRLATSRGYELRYSEDMKVSHPPRTYNEVLSKVRRVVGGNYTAAKREGRFAIAKVLFKSLMPPIRKILPALMARGLSIAERAQLLWLLFRIKLVASHETLLLLCGKSPNRT